MTSKVSRPPPPKPRKPGQVKVFRALYKYDANLADELSFDEGDTLYILDQSDNGWWKAKCGDKVGLIPNNYVEENTQSVDSPMHEAAKRGNTLFLQECISNRVSVNGLDKSGSTALHWAASSGHTDCVQMLFKQENVEINVQNKLGDTPLHSAAWRGHTDIVQMLLDKGANKGLKNKDGKLPADLAKEPSTAAVFQKLTRQSINNTDYGDDEDSD